MQPGWRFETVQVEAHSSKYDNARVCLLQPVNFSHRSGRDGNFTMAIFTCGRGGSIIVAQ